MASEPSGTVADSKANKPGRSEKTGVVVSDKRDKTITVEVRRLIKHRQYGKYIYRSTKYHAHDEKNDAGMGDKVEIRETRPQSKQKRWSLVRIVERNVLAEKVDKAKVEKKA